VEDCRGQAGAAPLPRLGSDLDFLVEFGEEKSLLDLARLKLEMEGELGRQVDVVTYRSLYHRLRDPLLQEQVAIL
jgi:predicted nucleotidyltransferase